MSEDSSDNIEKSPSIDVLLHEYNNLKSEIRQTQQQRMQIISLTVGAVGAVISIAGNVVLGSDTISPERRLLVAIGAGIAVHAIIIPSLIMMIATQQAVKRIGGYISVFIEPLVPGLRWEGRWAETRTRRGKAGLYGLGSIYYFLAALAWLLPLYGATQYPDRLLLVLVIVPFSVWALYLSYDLENAVSKGWKFVKWNASDQKI